MIVLLRARETWAGELECSVTWRGAAAREWGEATVYIPRPHPALDVDDDGIPRFIDENGAFYVEITDEALGVFRGIADVPTTNGNGIEIPVVDIAALMGIRSVSNAARYENIPAGAIAEQAYTQGFGGLGRAAIGRGRFSRSGPLLSYDFTGQTVEEIYADLMDLTGMEWRIDAAGDLHFGPPDGAYYPYILTDSADLIGSERSGSITDSAVEVISRNSLGMEWRTLNAEDETAGMWPAQVTIGQ